MMDNGGEVFLMVKVFIKKLMEIYIREVLKMDSSMVQEVSIME